MKLSEMNCIDREKKVPIYRQIHEILQQELRDGFYEQTERLPSEKELCSRFGVERNTVRNALQLLVDEGVVERVPGYGTRILRNDTNVVQAGVERMGQMRQNILMLTRETDPLGHQVEYFHLQLMQLLEKRISQMGYNLVFKTLSQNNKLEEIISYTCPAAILFDSYMQTEYYQQALELNIPCISINHYTPLFTSVISNNFDGAYKVAKLMAEAGHREIALITGKEGYQTTAERLSGFQSFYFQKNLIQEQKYIYIGNWLFESGVEIGEKILAIPKLERPTAVFAFNDDLAYGCLSCFEKHGVDVPGDISLVGFDRTARYTTVFKPITTVDVNIEAMVQYACWCLGEQLRGNSPKARAKIQVETIIIDGGTVKNIKGK